jgi:hypothetical protein
LSYKVSVRTLDADLASFTRVSAVNFVNPGTHGDPYKLLERAQDEEETGIGGQPGEPVLYVNTAGVSSVLVTGEEET